MQLIIKGRNLEINDRVRDYVERKIGRLDHYLPELQEVRVELSEEKSRRADQRHIAQVTARGKGAILRAEERSGDLFTSIDSVADKIHRQIRRYKGKRRRKIERAQVQAAAAEMLQMAADEEAFAALEEEETAAGRIVRTKRFQMTPMSEEEAIEQMELLGHDFFVFYNIVDAAINVLYRRSDSNYGLLQPELA